MQVLQLLLIEKSVEGFLKLLHEEKYCSIRMRKRKRISQNRITCLFVFHRNVNLDRFLSQRSLLEHRSLLKRKCQVEKANQRQNVQNHLFTDRDQNDENELS